MATRTSQNRLVYLPITFLLIFLSTNSLSPTGAVSAQVNSSGNIISSIAVGRNPINIAINEATNHIYVTNHDDKSLSVIDGLTNLVEPPVDLAYSNNRLAVNPDINRIFIGQTDSDSILLVNGETNSAIMSSVFGGSPGVIDVAVNPTRNRLYVVRNLDLLVEDYYPDSPKDFVASIPFSDQPFRVAVNPKYDFVFVISGSSPSLVYAIEGVSNEVSDIIPVGNNANAIAINSETNMIYVTNLTDGTVSIINGYTLRLSQTLKIPSQTGTASPSGVAINESTNHIYISLFDGQLVVLDGASNQFLGDPISIPGYLSGIAVNSITNRVYITNSSNNSITVIGDTFAKILNVDLLMQGIKPETDNNPFWEGIIYAGGSLDKMWCGTTIYDCGCAITSIAMLLNYMNVTETPVPVTGDTSTDPYTINYYFTLDSKDFPDCDRESPGNQPGKVSRGYLCGGVQWKAVDKYTADAHKLFGTQKIVFTAKYDWNPQTFRNTIDTDTPVILEEPNHFVLGTGYINNTFTINDPFFADRTTLDNKAYNNKAKKMVLFKRTQSDFSAISIGAISQFMIIDQNGRRTGFDPRTSNILQEIPNTQYYFDEGIADNSGENPPPPENTGLYWLQVPLPEAGKYTIQMDALINEPYDFVIYSYNRDADYSLNVFTAEKQHNENPSYTFNYNPNPGKTNLSFRTTIDIKPRSILNAFPCRRKSTVIPVAIISTDTFDALSVNEKTVIFNNAKEPYFVKRRPTNRYEKDVNGDGKLDLIFHFLLGDTNLTCSSTKGRLVGKTFDGMIIEGTDSIRMIK